MDFECFVRRVDGATMTMRLPMTIYDGSIFVMIMSGTSMRAIDINDSLAAKRLTCSGDINDIDDVTARRLICGSESYDTTMTPKCQRQTVARVEASDADDAGILFTRMIKRPSFEDAPLCLTSIDDDDDIFDVGSDTIRRTSGRRDDLQPAMFHVEGIDTDDGLTMTIHRKSGICPAPENRGIFLSTGIRGIF